MTNKEIEQVKQEVFEIQKKKPMSEQLEPMQAVANRIGAPIPVGYTQKTQAEFICDVFRNIHVVLQTETMVNACISAKRSCIWAAVAATVALLSAVAAWITVLVR